MWVNKWKGRVQRRRRIQTSGARNEKASRLSRDSNQTSRARKQNKSAEGTGGCGGRERTGGAFIRNRSLLSSRPPPPPPHLASHRRSRKRARSGRPSRPIPYFRPLPPSSAEVRFFCFQFSVGNFSRFSGERLGFYGGEGLEEFLELPR
jgi:hypothetical protein